MQGVDRHRGLKGVGAERTRIGETPVTLVQDGNFLPPRGAPARGFRNPECSRVGISGPINHA
jgi:hypothetical protein